MYGEVPQSVNEQMCWITMKTSKNILYTENKWWKNYRNYIKVFMSGKADDTWNNVSDIKFGELRRLIY